MRLWGTGLLRPAAATDRLGHHPGFGLSLVGIRFVTTSLTSVLALLLLGREPLSPPYLTVLAPQDYYRAQVLFLPVFGVAAWLLMSSAAYLVLRFAGRADAFGLVLNIVGFGMFVPMAVLWPTDWAMITLDVYRLPMVAVIHAGVEIWEALLFAIGFHRLFKLPRTPAILLGFLLGAIYVGLAMIFIR